MHMIEGVEVKELKMIKDNRGFLMEILRGSDKMKADGQKAFGQMYISTAYPAVIKGKHLHKLQTDHLTVIKGRAAIHVEDARENSPTKGKKEVILVGEDNWKLVKIPPGIWHSTENVGTEVCYFINYVTREYDHKEPDEYRGQFDEADRKMPWKPLVMA
ncbi:MAG: dTDP-4-dehydrorhamnose 3,5-epimerase family protein [Candidatus Burarchaeum sp.]|nr:dTDP-4-dehydrorhamnose 3,5-epimerase family protein [Candidatus Burarchaeum sp.]